MPKIIPKFYCLPVNTVNKLKKDYPKQIGIMPRYGSGVLTQAARNLSGEHMKCKEYYWFYVTERFAKAHLVEDPAEATARKLAGDDVWGPVAGIDSDKYKILYNEYKKDHQDLDRLLKEATGCVVLYR